MLPESSWLHPGQGKQKKDADVCVPEISFVDLKVFLRLKGCREEKLLYEFSLGIVLNYFGKECS